MRIMSHATVTLALAAALAGCGGGDAKTGGDGANTPSTDADVTVDMPQEDLGEVLAEVGGIKVGSNEFQLEAQRKAPADGKELSLEERKEILDKLVVEKMLYAEAKKKRIDLDPKIQKVMINTLLRQDVYNNVRNSDFTEEELEAYFNTNKEEFVVPEKVQIKRIFIKVSERRPDAEAKKLAQDLHAKVKADPTSFKELAAEHSEDPYRRRGGDLGFISKDGKPGIDPKVIDMAFTLPEQGISDVFEAGGGYNIVVAAARRERVERTFDQMKGSVLRKVKNDRYEELYDQYVDKVRGGYQVDVREDALEAVEVKSARRLSLGAPGRGGMAGPRAGGGDE